MALNSQPFLAPDGSIGIGRGFTVGAAGGPAATIGALRDIEQGLLPQTLALAQQQTAMIQLRVLQEQSAMRARLAMLAGTVVPSSPMAFELSFGTLNPITQPAPSAGGIVPSVIGAVGNLGAAFLNLKAQQELADAIKAQAQANPAVQQQLAQALIASGQLQIPGFAPGGVIGGAMSALGSGVGSGLLEGAMALLGGGGGSQFFTEKGRARRRITVMGPDGRVRFFEHAGAPVLFSRDLSAKRRVERIASKAKRGRRRNLRQVVCGTCQTIPCRGGHE